MENFNWGIIGTGNISKSFVNAVNGLEHSTVYAVASRTESRAAKYAKDNNIEVHYGCYLELTLDPRIDAVYIATPIALHYENIKLALLNGKNVLCEKTITTNHHQLRELIELANNRNLFLMEAMWTKCLPTYRRAQSWVKNGVIGDVRFVDVQLSNLFEVNPQHHRFNPTLGGGALLDSGVYAIAFALDFLGEEPEAIISTTYHNQDIDFDTYITLKYEKNKFAHIITGFSTRNRCSATIVGTKGIIEFPENFHYNSKLNLYDSSHCLLEQLELPFDINGFEYQILEAERCIRAKKKESEIIPLRASLATLKIIDTCKQHK